MLRTLREAGADDQVAELLARDPAAHVALDDSFAVATLPQTLRKVGTDDQATTVIERLPAAGRFGLFVKLGGNREEFRLGREPDGGAAPSWTWTDMD